MPGDNGPVTALLPPPVVLFDLDGTLTDSAPGIVGGYLHAVRTVGGPEPDPETAAGVVGPPMIENLRALGITDDRLDRAIAAYFEYYDAGDGWADNAVFPGIEDVLQGLRARGVRLAIATSKKERLANRILGHFGLADHFEFVGGASEDQSRRAKSDVIAHTLTGLGIAPVRGGTRGVVLVGDRHHDVDGAAEWGIPTIFAGWGYGRPGESAGARWVAETVADLPSLLQFSGEDEAHPNQPDARLG